MRYAWPLLAAGLIIAPAAHAKPRPRQPAYADPADVITAELAFARLIREKGQSSAYRATMANDAVMFTPRRAAAAAWVKDHNDPATATKRSPREVWISCDGSYALADGVWSNGAEHGWFSDVWQRQKNGGYKWVLQDGDRSKNTDAATDVIAAHVADCPRPKDKAALAVWNARPAPSAGTTQSGAGHSADMTLHWEFTAQPDGAHNLSAWMWKDGDMRPIHVTEVDAPGAPAHR